MIFSTHRPLREGSQVQVIERTCADPFLHASGVKVHSAMPLRQPLPI